ncbi:MAG: porin family protein [Hyphomonadaceae bacterium]|nr:porin family protein [Hyphomonadaceae bacterium]
MKRIIGAAMLVAATPAAWAQNAQSSVEEGRSYFSISAGAIAGSDFNYDIPGGDVEVETGAGYGVNAAYGYVFSPSIRGEVSLSYSEQDIDIVRRRGGPQILIFEDPGAVTAWTLGANGYYDFVTSGSFRPYVGAGIGVSSLDVNDRVLLDAGTAVSARAIAGARWMMSDRTSLFLEGRYDAYLMEIDEGVGFTNADSNLGVDAFSVQGGLRFGF